jgi:hypothetical protein
MDTLVAALGPAFAAGFALQRLLEILDPIIPARLSPQRKRMMLGLVSLVGGFAAAAALKEIRVLALFKVTDVGLLDYLVTGLIISAGTEGFNSILKFLSYKKEETKAEAISEKINASRAFRAEAGLTMDSFAFSPEHVGDTIWEEGMTLEEALEKSLKTEIKKRWSSKFVEATWKKQPFGDYTADSDDPKVVVFHATRSVANELGLPLPKARVIKLQSEVGLETTAAAALGSMLDALV